MRILLNSIGTAGDIHPFIAVGRALAARGHHVVFLTNPYFKDRINQAGLGFWPLGSTDQYLAFVRHADLVAGARSPTFVIRELILPALEPTVEAVRQMRTGNAFSPDLIFSHHICFGAAAAGELFGIRHAQGVLAPLFWLSRHERVLLPSLPLPRAPGWLDRLLRSAMRPVGRMLIDRPLNAHRRSLGLPPRHNQALLAARGGDSLTQRDRLPSGSSGTPTLALWSPHFRPSLADDPTPGRICGFASWDRPNTDDSQAQRERELTKWMETGQPPFVVTLGSSVSHHGHNVYDIATNACTSLNARAVLLTGIDQAGITRPDCVRSMPYAPYARILPRASAIIHHAGIGTLAAAMRAGKPSIIIPFANDEFDNAYRAERLGVATVIPRRKLSAATLAAAVTSVTTDASMHAKCKALADVLEFENGAEAAATKLERLASQ